jgi:hypothetical protein
MRSSPWIRGAPQVGVVPPRLYYVQGVCLFPTLARRTANDSVRIGVLIPENVHNSYFALASPYPEANDGIFQLPTSVLPRIHLECAT